MDLDALSRSLGPLQQAMQQANAQRTAASFTGSAGGGAVKVTLRGDLTVQGVSIAPAAASASAGDASMLEDLVAAAVGDALRQHRNRFGATPEEQLSKVFSGPGMGSMLAPLMAAMGGRV